MDQTDRDPLHRALMDIILDFPPFPKDPPFPVNVKDYLARRRDYWAGAGEMDCALCSHQVRRHEDSLSRCDCCSRIGSIALAPVVPHQIDSADLERFGRHVGELRGLDVTREPELCGDCDNEQIVLTADDFDGIPRCEHRSYRHHSHLSQGGQIAPQR